MGCHVYNTTINKEIKLFTKRLKSQAATLLNLDNRYSTLTEPSLALYWTEIIRKSFFCPTNSNVAGIQSEYPSKLRSIISFAAVVIRSCMIMDVRYSESLVNREWEGWGPESCDSRSRLTAYCHRLSNHTVNCMAAWLINS